MRYWMALVFARDNLLLGQPTSTSLDDWANAMNCTRRNAQLVIKKLVEQQWIEWKSGIGRGNLPVVTLLQCAASTIEQEAQRLLGLNKLDQALNLIEVERRERFLGHFIEQYRHTHLAPNHHVLQIPFYRATHALDPIAISRRSEQHIADHLYAKLLKWDKDKKQYVGDLAMHWHPTDVGIELTLRKGLKFHDRTPLQAEGVKAHFERLTAAQNNNAALFALIDKVEVTSPYTLEVHSTYAQPILPKLLALGAMGISKLESGKVVGSGPFRLTEQNHWRTLLEVFDDYHGFRPWVDGVEIWNLGAQADKLSLPKLHNADIISTHLLDDSTQNAFHHHSQWEMGAEYLLLNQNRQHLLDADTRAALINAVKKVGLPQSIIKEQVKPASSMTSVNGDICDASIYRQSISNSADSKLANTLAEHPLTLITYQLDQHIRLAQHIAEQLTALGIAVTVTVYEFPQFCKQENLAKADLIISGEVFSDDIELSYLDWLLTNHALNNCLTKELKSELKQAINCAIAEEEPPKRLNRLQQIEQQLIKHKTYLPLFHVKQQMSTSQSVTSTELLANGWIDFSTVVI